MINFTIKFPPCNVAFIEHFKIYSENNRNGCEYSFHRKYRSQVKMKGGSLHDLPFTENGSMNSSHLLTIQKHLVNDCTLIEESKKNIACLEDDMVIV